MYAPDAFAGEIVVAGSSTVFTLSERMKQRFEEEGFSGQMTIDSIGSGAGFERFCVAGETDIANSSRKIKESEVESCKGIGREPIEFQVGIDALAVVVSADNDFATDVSLDELAAIFSKAERWSDVRSDWPAEPIQRFSPGTDSGTFDYFVEAIMAPAYPNAEGKPDAEAGEAAMLESEGTQFSEDDNVLVQGVEGSPYAIGYFGYAYFQENQGGLKTVSVDGVAPTEETAESGEYPISRPLFIYSAPAIMQEKSQVAAFLWFYLNNVNDEILDIGYFPVSEDRMQEKSAPATSRAEMSARRRIPARRCPLIVFISYASEHRAIADEIALALRGEGYEVFLDRSALPEGDAYNARIRKAIEGCDLFVFLLSPEAVAPGRYTLSELKFAEKKWSSPVGHVLPVLVQPTDKRRSPPTESRRRSAARAATWLRRSWSR